MTMYLSLRIGILLLLRIVNCRWVVSDDAVRRQFLSKRKDLQFMKAMVQSRHLGVGHCFAPDERKRLDPCFDPYGIITQWTGQISVDLQTCQTPQKGSKVAIICGESYVNRSS